MKKIIYASVLSFALSFSSCSKDYLETAPTDKVDAGTLLKTTKGAQVAMDGIYRMLYTPGWATANTTEFIGLMSTKIVGSLMGEDFLQDAEGSGWFYYDYLYNVRNFYTSTAWRSYGTWNFYYSLISNANYILAAEKTMTGDPKDVKKIMAQAYAIRAYAYFDLIRIFQQTYIGHQTAPGVPVYTEPTIASSKGKGRGTVEEVYSRINADLDEAIKLFGDNKAGQANKSQLDYYMANAIKANVALTQNKWADAEKYANEALSKPNLSMISGNDLFSGFNSVKLPNVLWGAEIIAAQSAGFGSFFSHMDAGAEQYAESSRKCIYNWLYDQIPNTDARKKWWNGEEDGGTPTTQPYNQVKFRYADKSANLGDYIYMRAEEMHFVKMEALANQGKLVEAKTALETLLKLRNPTGYQLTLANIVMSKDLMMGSIGTPSTLMDHIILQRRIELWGEAERIFDILRLKTGFDRNAPGTNHTFIPVKWNSMEPANKEFILTIPQKEFDGNASMDPKKDQNPL